MILLDTPESDTMSKMVFDRLDVDNDGVIRLTDLKTAYQSLGLYPTNTELKRILKEACLDSPVKDKLTFSSFRKLRLNHGNSDLNILAEFKKFDVDDLHRGFITPFSIQITLSKDGWKEEDVLQAISFLMSLDTNNDQKVSFQDLHDFLTNKLPDAWLGWIYENITREVEIEEIISVLVEHGFNYDVAMELIEKTKKEGRQVSRMTFADHCRNFVHVIKE
ncbi:hypothetical protein GEMRC1_002422 [Eukaryota sp. GEM-RC1]